MTKRRHHHTILQQLSNFRIPHIVVIDVSNPARDSDGKDVPAEIRWIVCIEVVLAVLAGTATVLDNVLVVVADDDREIAVGLDSILPNGLDGLDAAVTVEARDLLNDVGSQLTRLLELGLPALDGSHVRHSRDCVPDCKIGLVVLL